MKKQTTAIAGILVLVMLVVGFSPCKAQNESSQRIFYDMGLTMLADFTTSPVQSAVSKSENGIYNPWTGSVFYPDTTIYYQSHGLSIASYILRVRANVLQPSDNTALSLSATPSLQFGFVWENPGDATSLMACNLPLMAEFSFGAGSTFKSDADKGGYVGAGYEFNLSPILDFKSEFAGKKSWGMPAFAVGYRFWVKETKLAELNLKLGFGKNTEIPPPSYNQKVSAPLSVRLAFFWFMNY